LNNQVMAVIAVDPAREAKTVPAKL